MNNCACNDSTIDSKFYGKIKITLPQNLVEQSDGTYKNILTQKAFRDCDDIDLINTIFIIDSIFYLDTKTIKIPKDCTLVFNGGSLNNGEIQLNNTLILPQAININELCSNLKISGTFRDGQIWQENSRLYGIISNLKHDLFADLDSAQLINGITLTEV